MILKARQILSSNNVPKHSNSKNLKHTEYLCALTKSRAAFIQHCQATSFEGAVDAISEYLPLIVNLTKQAEEKKKEFSTVPLKVQW